jgi:type IV secretory pathway TrbF-like protein
MTDVSWTPPPAKDYRAAKRQFLDIYGSGAVMNSTLKIAVICLSAACVGLVTVSVKSFALVRNVKPVIVRIDGSGRAEAMAPASLEYKPQEAEIKYFLIDFVQRHYGRMRATVRDNYARSLYFLDGRLADALIEENKKTNTLETFMAGDGLESDVVIKNVSLEDLRTPPYRATVDFERVTYAGGDRSISRRDRYVANLVFVVKDQVPNAMIPINPLGLTITYFREDQAFQSGTR